MAKAIFLEGLDGSGKSTQIKLLADYLKSQGEEVLVLREPGGSDYYEALRSVHFDPKLERPPISDVLMSGAGRAANIELSRSATSKGSWVLSDRAYPSTYAYQVAQGNPWEVVNQVNALAVADFRYDIKVLIDIPVKLAKERLATSGDKLDFWEAKSEAFFTDVRDNYLRLAREEAHTIIDGDQTIDAVQAAIRKLL